MQKQLLRSIILLQSFLLLPYALRAGTNCTGNDITFNSVTITGVSTSQVMYDYEINNIGTETMLFSKLIIQNYLSADNTFGAGDVAAGSSILSYTGSTQVEAGATFSSQYQANHSNTLGTYKYLIVQLSYSDGECDATNNQIVVCLKPDAHFTGLTVASLTGSSANYEFEIINKGGDTLFFNKLILQNYRSADNTFGDDYPAGGSFLTFTGKSYLLPNESYTDTYAANGDFSSTPYVIAKLSYSGVSECNLTNNEAVGMIPLTTGLANTSVANTVIWNTEAKNFIVDNWNGSSFSTSLEYQLYNANGVIQSSGSVDIGKATVVTANPGIYMLVITDGKESKSVKVLY